MILQEILFPEKDICEIIDLYYRGVFENNIIKEGNTLKFNTYFNSFSIEKWIKYTSLTNLSIVLEVLGKGKINIVNVYYDKKKLIRKQLKSISIDFSERKYKEIEIDNIGLKGIIYFEIEAENDFKFFSGKYTCNISESETNNVDLAICICTYKREKFVKRNVKILKDNIINKKESQLCNHLDVFVIDNAQTLDRNDFEYEKIHYFNNKNVGGSGGFTRGIIEATFKSNKKITHCILMDDDITLSSSVIERTFSFLKILKKEFSKKMIGGAMLYQEQQYSQGESGAEWINTKSKLRNSNYDLRNEELIILNELDDININYNGWWYCCIPTTIITKNNLPLPLFIHMDDVEYGLRNKEGFIMLNGICVWHPNVENKGPITNYYYNYRNMLIMNSRYKKFKKTKLKIRLFGFMMYYLFQYKYSEIELGFKGCFDYFKGIDEFKKIDGEKLHKDLLKYNYKKEKNKINISRNQRNPKNVVVQIGILIKGAIGCIMPKFLHNKVYTSNRSTVTSCFAKKTAVYDVENENIIYLKRDFKKMKKCFREYNEICQIINKRNDSITDEWNSRLEEITNLKFWNNYLGL